MGGFKSHRPRLIELMKSGPRVYIARPRDMEKLRNHELRNGLLGLLEAVSQVVYNKMKERQRATLGLNGNGTQNTEIPFKRNP